MRKIQMIRKTLRNVLFCTIGTIISMGVIHLFLDYRYIKLPLAEESLKRALLYIFVEQIAYYHDVGYYCKDTSYLSKNMTAQIDYIKSQEYNITIYLDNGNKINMGQKEIDISEHDFKIVPYINEKGFLIIGLGQFDNDDEVSVMSIDQNRVLKVYNEDIELSLIDKIAKKYKKLLVNILD